MGVLTEGTNLRVATVIDAASGVDSANQVSMHMNIHVTGLASAAKVRQPQPRR